MSKYFKAPYSYSKISCYNDCPRKFRYTYVQKMYRFENNVWFEKGKFVHYLLDNYPTPPPKPFKFQFHALNQQKELVELVHILLKKDIFLKELLTKYKIKSEYQFFLNSELTPIKGRKDSLFYGVIDYIGKIDDVLIMADWKTGKSKSDIIQLKHYAIWSFKAMPHINTIKILLYYIEQDIVEEVILKREEMPNLIFELINNIDLIEKDETYNKNRNDKCQYCAYFNECIKEDMKW